MATKSVVIIGAGIGGLATAIQLARQGLSVTIYEKTALPGGRCQPLSKQGHIFDTGPTMYLFPEIYTDFFTSIGENLSSHLTLLPTHPTYRLHFPDHTSLLLSSDQQLMRSQLEALEPGSYSQFLRYLEAAKHHYDLALRHLITNPLTSPLDYFNPLIGLSLLKSHALQTHSQYVSSYFHHPKLQAAFTFQDSYLSLNPFQSPAIFSLFTYTETCDGNLLPVGGMHQVIQALVKIAAKYPIRIHYNSPVKCINTSHNRVTGITLADDSLVNSDFVVSNADLTYTYSHLLPSDPSAPQLLQKKYSSSCLSFHWGLSKPYPQLATHNLFFSPNYQAGFDQVINQPLPPDAPHFYIQAPTRTDPSRAPKNQDTLSVMIPINHIYPSHPVNWPVLTTKLRKYVLSHLHSFGLSDIESHLKFEVSYSPPEWESYLNLTYGSVYGLHHNFSQMGYFRPKRQHQKYKNLFFVGCSNHPGSGLPTVLLSSRFTSQQLLKSLQ